MGQYIRIPPSEFYEDHPAAQAAGQAAGQTAAFGPENPFYAASTLPYHAPPFDRIKDTDYQPALEAGMAEQLKEVDAIANNPAPPTFENTLVALEKSGQLYARVAEVFDGMTGANTNPTLDKVDEIESPKRAAHDDAIFLNEKLFARVAAIYKQIDSLGLDAESKRLVEIYYKHFVHQGANLSAEDKAKLKKLNEEESTLENAFRTKLLAATKDAAYTTKDKNALKGLSDAQMEAAAEAAKGRKVEGYVLPLQNTTQQPILVSLEDRATRQALFEDSWNRAERGGANDTRDTIARLAQLRAEKAKLLGYRELCGVATGRPDGEDAGGGGEVYGRAGAGLDGECEWRRARTSRPSLTRRRAGSSCSRGTGSSTPDQVRKAKYDLDEAQVKPYFEV